MCIRNGKINTKIDIYFGWKTPPLFDLLLVDFELVNDDELLVDVVEDINGLVDVEVALLLLIPLVR